MILSQPIQFGITNQGKQSIIGLGLRLHHKFWRNYLIQMLHEHSYCVFIRGSTSVPNVCRIVCDLQCYDSPNDDGFKPHSGACAQIV